MSTRRQTATVNATARVIQNLAEPVCKRGIFAKPSRDVRSVW